MSVTALNNTNYYIPTVSTRQSPANDNTNVTESNSKEQVQQVQQTNENNSKVQAASNSYATNQENTSNNNASQNGSNQTPVYTGEEMLSAMNSEESSNSTGGSKQLDESEKQQVEELKSRDAEVKAHEQAHIAAGGSYVKGGASYDYQTGPDGKQYAVGGEVSIDTSAVEGDPQATINKAQVIIKAAMAPAEPSGQDKAVASQARQMMASARKEQLNQQTSSQGEDSSSQVSVGSSSSESDTSSQVSSMQYNNGSQAENTSSGSAESSASTSNAGIINNIAANNTTNQTQNNTQKTAKNEPVNVDTAPKMNTQSLKSDTSYIPQVNVAGSGLYQAFSNAGMSPIKNANALMQVAGSLISLMA